MIVIIIQIMNKIKQKFIQIMNKLKQNKTNIYYNQYDKIYFLIYFFTVIINV